MYIIKVILVLLFFLCHLEPEASGQSARPNVILIMADDLGWGDVGFNGNVLIETPELNRMAANGIQFSRFYAAAPVCSPTRGSVLTGRHPERYGITYANEGYLKTEEVTLAETLRKHGYVTGHFGKWHLGTLTETMKDGRRGGSGANVYSPPWENGFDVCFSTEQAVPTWDPMKNQSFETKFWTGPGAFATENLEGDDSKVIMDRALPFIEDAVKSGSSFFTVIWFHTPHSPVVAGPEYRKKYSALSEDKQHYYGCITAMDEQIGRLRRVLRELKVSDNTVVFFTSDNGPAGRGGGTLQEPGDRQQGSAGPFRGRKGSLYEGGIRVPGLMEWPARITSHRVVNYPVSTNDYFPTILDLSGIKAIPEQFYPLDGISFLELVDKKEEQWDKSKQIPFFSRKQRALSTLQYKLYSNDDGRTYALYDLLNDPSETNNMATQHPGVVTEMSGKLESWIRSWQ